MIVLHEPVLSLLVVLALGEHLYRRLALLKATLLLALLKATLLLALLPALLLGLLIVSLLALLFKLSLIFSCGFSFYSSKSKIKIEITDLIL